MNHERLTRSRTPLLAGLGLAATLLLSGCATVSSPGKVDTGSTTPAPSSVSSTPTNMSASSSAATPSSASASANSEASATTSSGSYRVDRCEATDLKGTIGSTSGAAGSKILDLQLQNTGDSPCSLQGWPGVSFITGAGKQIGAAADFDRGTAHETVTLQPGGHAHASLKIGAAQDYSSAKCDPVTATRLRVYAPGLKDSITVTTSKQDACRNPSVHLLTVQALHATT